MYVPFHLWEFILQGNLNSCDMMYKRSYYSIVYIQKMLKKNNKCPSIMCSLVKKNEDINNKKRFLIYVINWKKQYAKQQI